jgi:hypothetical protein
MAVKRRVLLMHEGHLLGEILEHILTGLQEVDLVGVWPLEASSVSSIAAQNLDLLLIAEETGSEERLSALTIHILENCANLPIFRVKLDCNELRIYTSQALPARVADLAERIRQIPISQLGL